MSFADLLNKPLPSKTVTEAADMDITEGAVCPECGKNPCVCGTECGTECDPTTPAVAEPVAAVTPAIDDELPLASEPVGSMDDTPVGDDLTPEEDRRVDDTMNAVATPLLVNDLDESSFNEFTESADLDMAVAEGFLTERTIIKFDKNAKKAQLYEVAVAAVAREKKDPLFRKLQTVYKMERILKAKLRKKYDAAARRKVKEYLQRAGKSKSGFLANIVKKITGK